MYLIEESIEALQKYFQRDPKLKDIEEELDCNGDSDTVDSAWQDYERCHPAMPPLMQYEIKTPVQLMEQLKKMWGDSSDLADEEFIKLFVVSAFRQTIKEAVDKEEIHKKSDVSLPAYIYNF